MSEMSDERPEVEAFLLGFGLAIRAIDRFVTSVSKESDQELFDLAEEVAVALYPPYPPPPPPRKAFGDGERADGIRME